MVDVKKHAQDILKDITSIEKKVVQMSRHRLRKAIAVPPKKLYVEGVDATRDIVNYSVKSQKKIGDSILSRIVEIEGVPASAKTVSDKVQSVTEGILGVQQDLVDNVADAMVKIDPLKVPELIKGLVGKSNGNGKMKAVPATRKPTNGRKS